MDSSVNKQPKLGDEIAEIATFIIAQDPSYKEEERADIAKAIELHFAYGTAMVIRDEQDVAAVARWNWVGNDTVLVLDTIIRRDLRGKGLLKRMVLLAIQRNPQCKYLAFTRSNHSKRGVRTYRVEDILKLKRYTNNLQEVCYG